MVRQDFEIIGEITEIETIAVGRRVRERIRFQKSYGRGRWRAQGHQAKEISARELAMAKKATPRFAICIDNSGYPASLELHKMYRVLPDDVAERDGDLRVVELLHIRYSEEEKEAVRAGHLTDWSGPAGIQLVTAERA